MLALVIAPALFAGTAGGSEVPPPQAGETDRFLASSAPLECAWGTHFAARAMDASRASAILERLVTYAGSGLAEPPDERARQFALLDAAIVLGASPAPEQVSAIWALDPVGALVLVAQRSTGTWVC